jgi:hypothetical protein
VKPLTEADLAWLENRVGTHRWSPEDCRRMLADLRIAREPWLAGMHKGPAMTPDEVIADLRAARLDALEVEIDPIEAGLCLMSRIPGVDQDALNEAYKHPGRLIFVDGGE